MSSDRTNFSKSHDSVSAQSTTLEPRRGNVDHEDFISTPWRPRGEHAGRASQNEEDLEKSQALQRTDGKDRKRAREDATLPSSQRSSSGFLLPNIGRPSRLAFLTRPSLRESKGKRVTTIHNVGGANTKRTSYSSQSSSRVGGSPLAMQVSTPDDSGAGAMAHGALDGQDSGRLKSGNGESRPTMLAYGMDSSKHSGSAVSSGFDTDPTQIVNMALSLNEGRRRQTSGFRVASSEAGLRSSFMLEGGRSGRVNAHRQSSLPHHSQPRNSVPSDGFAVATQGSDHMFSSSASGEGSTIDEIYSEASTRPGLQLNSVADSPDISAATKFRANKARNHFELLYEYRRLLSHLPPLRTRTQLPQEKATEGRSYNPIQCARNRKIRTSEKKLQEEDTEAWKDVQGVRGWVNAIIANHTETRNDPDQSVRLPVQRHLYPDVSQNAQHVAKTSLPTSTPVTKGALQQPAKQRRHRLNWAVSPEELLDDIYWLEQGFNKTKMEDREGNRIYPQDVQLRYADGRSAVATSDEEQVCSTDSSQATDIVEAETRLSTPPELPNFTSGEKKGRRRDRIRSRDFRAHRDKESDSSDDDSRTKRKRLKKNLLQSLHRPSTFSSSNDESSEDGEPESEERDNGAQSGPSNVVNNLDSTTKMPETGVSIAATAKATPVSRELPELPAVSSAAKSLHGFDGRGRPFAQQSRESQTPSQSSRKSPRQRQTPRPSLDVERVVRSSLDYDTPAEESPLTSHFPGIATNLSPPNTRSPSPAKRFLHSLSDRDQGKRHHPTETPHWPDGLASPDSERRSHEISKGRDDISFRSGGFSPHTRLKRRSSDPLAGAEVAVKHHQQSHKRSDTETITAGMRTSNKLGSGQDPVSRLRGFLKGSSRIGDLVGNEITRAGDFFWRREPGPGVNGPSVATNGIDPFQKGEQEDHRTRDQRTGSIPVRRGATSAIEEDPPEKATTASLRPGLPERKSYFTNNLPNFTSVFPRDRGVRDHREGTTTPPRQLAVSNKGGGMNHFSRTPTAHVRSSSKSSRAVGSGVKPYTPTGSLSPTASSGDSRRARAERTSNQASSLPVTASIKASRALNRAISGGDRKLSQDDSVAKRKSRRLTLNDLELPQTFPLTRNGEEEDIALTGREIGRTEALLSTTLIRARQLLRVHSPEGRVLHHALSDDRHPHDHLLSHLTAIEAYLTTLSNDQTTFQDTLDQLTSTTSTITKPATTSTISTSSTSSTSRFSDLHSSLSRLSTLSSLASDSMTPRILSLADSTTDLPTTLSTSSSLSVQKVQARLEAGLRVQRRRRRGWVVGRLLRWGRLLGYLVVEWGVVGLLWGIWFVVFVVRVVVWIVVKSVGVWGWLLWLR